MRFSRFSGLLAAALLTAPPSALWAEPVATLGTILGNSDTTIRRMARLPVGGLQAVETTDGQLLFISDTGRYVLRGKAYDLWHCLATTDRAAAPAATGCGQQTAQRTLITAQMFGVRGTPFVIAPDGRLHRTPRPCAPSSRPAGNGPPTRPWGNCPTLMPCSATGRGRAARCSTWWGARGSSWI